MIKIVLICFLAALPLTAQIAPVKVACVGNSITIGWGLANPEKAYPQQLGGLLGNSYEVKNFGVSGRTMLKKGDYPYWNEPQLKEAINYKPQILTICLGTNDSKPWNWIYKDDFFSNYSEMINDFRKDNPHLQVFVCFPSPVSPKVTGITDTVIHYQVIPIIDSVSKALNTYTIDFYEKLTGDLAYFPDGIHPNEYGSFIMAGVVYNAIKKSPSGIIRLFYPKSYTFEKGEPVTLYWKTTDSSKTTVNGKAANDTDSMVVYPAETTTYTLITNGSVLDTASITVNYIHPGIIKSFTVNNSISDQGYHQPRVLKWSASNGSSVSLNGVSVGANDSLIVYPDTTTTYQLIAAGDTTSTNSITIKVMKPEMINRVLNHSINASQFVSGYPSANAVDGDTTTYWQSQAVNPQWITVDMNENFVINRVIVHWDKVFATSFQLAVISEKGDTTKLYSTTTGTGRINDLSGLKGTGRFLNLICINKNYPAFGYRLKEIEVYGVPVITASLEKSDNSKPAGFLLEQNFPNPFNPSTIISWHLKESSFVTLKIYDILGNEVETLVNEFQNTGAHSILFNSQQTSNHKQLSSGVYFYRISVISVSGKTNNFTDTKKLIIMK